jgi:hypothetical protein
MPEPGGQPTMHAMIPLRQMSYEEFGKLRFLDFFPRTEAYQEDHEGGLESGIGLACTEGYLNTIFTSPVDVEWQTAELCLELGTDCPVNEGHALLDALGLALRKGMTSQQVKEVLGLPEKDDPTWLVFVIGDQWPYYVGCLVTDKGLHRVWIGRKDLADANTEILGD